MSDYKAKMHQNRFRLGLSPRPTGRAYSAPPDHLAVFKGPTSKRKEGKGEEEGKGRKREGKREGRGGEEEGRGRGRTTLHTPCRKFLATPLFVSIPAGTP